MANQRNDKDLAELLKAARAIPGSTARQKAVSAMVEAAAAAGSRRWSSISWRSAVPAAAFVVVAAATGFWLFPRQHSVALADVARAMANVQSAHFVGWTADQATGERRRFECWIKGPSKLRLIEEGESEFEVADNGEQTVILRDYNRVLTAWIKVPKQVPGLEDVTSYLETLVSGQGLVSNAETYGYMVESVSRGTLPSGYPATIIQLRHLDGGKAVLVADTNSSLLAEWKVYDRNGTLAKSVDSIEYNIDIPDSTFVLTIPEGWPVIDFLTPASPDIAAAHEAEEAKLKSAGWEWVNDIGGMSGSRYHPGLYFQTLDKNGGIILYSRSRNVYHVIGRALVFTEGGAYQRIVEDDEIEAPGAPEFRRAETETPRNPRVEAAAEEFKRAGGKVILSLGQGGGSCGSSYHSKLHFQVLRHDGCVIAYMPESNSYRVFGKVRVFGMGLDTVVEDAEIPAPGEPERLP